MFVSVEENPNCAADERMLRDSDPHKVVLEVETTPSTGHAGWWEVTGVGEGGTFCPAKATLVEDSSDGTAWLVYGGSWGLRFKPLGEKHTWSLEDKTQWGLPFLVLDSSGASIKFKD